MLLSLFENLMFFDVSKNIKIQKVINECLLMKMPFLTNNRQVAYCET